MLKSYTGEHLRRIKLPLGGIGTGTVSLSGRVRCRGRENGREVVLLADRLMEIEGIAHET